MSPFHKRKHAISHASDVHESHPSKSDRSSRKTFAANDSDASSTTLSQGPASPHLDDMEKHLSGRARLLETAKKAFRKDSLPAQVEVTEEPPPLIISDWQVRQVEHLANERMKLANRQGKVPLDPKEVADLALLSMHYLTYHKEFLDSLDDPTEGTFSNHLETNQWALYNIGKAEDNLRDLLLSRAVGSGEQNEIGARPQGGALAVEHQPDPKPSWIHSLLHKRSSRTREEKGKQPAQEPDVSGVEFGQRPSLNPLKLSSLDAMSMIPPPPQPSVTTTLYTAHVPDHPLPNIPSTTGPWNIGRLDNSDWESSDGSSNDFANSYPATTENSPEETSSQQASRGHQAGRNESSIHHSRRREHIFRCSRVSWPGQQADEAPAAWTRRSTSPDSRYSLYPLFTNFHPGVRQRDMDAQLDQPGHASLPSCRDLESEVDARGKRFIPTPYGLYEVKPYPLRRPLRSRTDTSRDAQFADHVKCLPSNLSAATTSPGETPPLHPRTSSPLVDPEGSQTPAGHHVLSRTDSEHQLPFPFSPDGSRMNLPSIADENLHFYDRKHSFQLPQAAREEVASSHGIIARPGCERDAERARKFQQRMEGIRSQPSLCTRGRLGNDTPEPPLFTPLIRGVQPRDPGSDGFVDGIFIRPSMRPKRNVRLSGSISGANHDLVSDAKGRYNEVKDSHPTSSDNIPSISPSGAVSFPSGRTYQMRRRWTTNLPAWINNNDVPDPMAARPTDMYRTMFSRVDRADSMGAEVPNPLSQNLHYHPYPRRSRVPTRVEMGTDAESESHSMLVLPSTEHGEPMPSMRAAEILASLTPGRADARSRSRSRQGTYDDGSANDETIVPPTRYYDASLQPRAEREWLWEEASGSNAARSDGRSDVLNEFEDSVSKRRRERRAHWAGLREKEENEKEGESRGQ